MTACASAEGRHPTSSGRRTLLEKVCVPSGTCRWWSVSLSSPSTIKSIPVAEEEIAGTCCTTMGCLLFAQGAPLARFVNLLIDVPTQACLGLVHVGPELLCLPHKICIFLQADISVLLGP